MAYRQDRSPRAPLPLPAAHAGSRPSRRAFPASSSSRPAARTARPTVPDQSLFTLRPANVVDASDARPRYSNSSNVAAYPLPGHSPLAVPAAIAPLRPIPYLNRSIPAAMAEETPDV